MEDPRAPNMPWVSLYFVVSDVEKSIDFYQKAFGFEVNKKVPDEQGNIAHVEMRYKDEVSVMFCPEGAWGSSNKTPKHNGLEASQTFYVYFDDADATFKKAVETGATVVEEPQDTFWGDRFSAVSDPDGYKWAIATFKGAAVNQ